jgi:hypothetical protein
MPKAAENLEFSTRGWYRLFWDADIPVDFISASTLDRTSLNKYKAIIMPFPVFISDSILKKLSAYVENGGNLVSEAGIARFNENGYSNRGEISKFASQLFGVKQTGFTMVSEPGNGHRWSPRPRTWGEFLDATMLKGKDDLDGVQTRANVYLQTFDCIDSKPCLWYNDKIAGTIRNYGKGKAWLFGTYIGHSGTAYRDNYTPEFVKSLMSKCGIKPQYEGGFLVRKRTVNGKEALIITNPTNQKRTEQLDISDWKNAITLFDEPVKIANNKITITLKSLDVGVVILQ